MFRFTIRDVLWLMMVVGLAVAFVLQRGRALEFEGENAALWRSHQMMFEAIQILDSDNNAVLRNLPRMEPIYATETAETQELKPD